MKTVRFLTTLVLALVCFAAQADTPLEECRFKAELAKTTATHRDNGYAPDAVLGHFIKVGVPPELAGKIVIWVYNNPTMPPEYFFAQLNKACDELERWSKKKSS